MDVAIYADGGGSLGYGHLVRTNALAQECLKRGYDVTYITATPDPTRDITCGDVTISAVDEPGELVPRSATMKPDILVTDSYEIGEELQRQVRTTVQRFCAVMDWAPHSICCDVLVNGNLYADSLDYEWTGSKPEFCLGPDYLLLREEVRQYINRDPPSNPSPERALITMGGSDGENVTPSAVRAFDGYDLTVDVIVGPGFDNESAIREAVDSTDCDFEIRVTPSNLPNLMYRSDFAISALGTTVYELMATVTPFVGIQTASNQKYTSQHLKGKDWAIIRDYTISSIQTGIRKISNQQVINQMRLGLNGVLTPYCVSNVANALSS